MTRKALDTIRTWPEPNDKRLMDRGFVAGAAEKGQQATLTGGYLNPFKLAFVAPNPSAPKTLSAEAGSDRALLDDGQLGGQGACSEQDREVVRRLHREAT